MTSCYAHAELFTSVTACVSVSVRNVSIPGCWRSTATEFRDRKPRPFPLATLSLLGQTEQVQTLSAYVCVRMRQPVSGKYCEKCEKLLSIFINAHQEGITETLAC